ncbi:MAG TPA: penicillin-insensitive murein endopeptidase [Pyrinomonadaceae bacterium]|nr:penicillin-insensitive murein endopeptidase [Pyrinomonadaceae bacterium]
MPDNNSNGAFALVSVPGSEKVSPAFKEKVIKIASDLGTNPNFLMAVMSFESGETFSPSVRNPVSGAVGLIQFMKPTAQGLGTTQDALAQMTAEEQLDFVAKHYRPFKGRLKSIEDAYMAVLLPSAVGKGANHVLFRKPSTRFTQNRGLDINGDGVVTVGEAADRVRAKLGASGAGVGQTLHRGSQGAEVQRLQEELVDIGYLTRAQLLTGPGSFGAQTEAALKKFQRDNHLDPGGAFDAETQAVFRELNDGVKLGSRGNVVRGLQDRLVEVGAMTVAEVASGPGIFGSKTDAALKTFQRNHGMEATGVLTDQTYQALLLAAHDAVPKTDLQDSTSVETVLPESGIGFVTFNREPGGRDQVGRASTIRAIQHLGELWHERHPTIPLAVGDISRRGGGPFPPHASHKDGRDADFRPLTNNGRNEPTNIDAANFSHALTRELILLIREAVNPEVIFFNDPLTIQEGLTRRAQGHHNHLHVRFR